jgi:hypothetical protein
MHTSEWPRINANVIIDLDSGSGMGRLMRREEGIVRRVGSVFILLDQDRRLIHISKRHVIAWWETD